MQKKVEKWNFELSKVISFTLLYFTLQYCIGQIFYNFKLFLLISLCFQVVSD